MSEIEIEIQNFDNRGFGFKVHKSDTHKGGLVITEVYLNTPASEVDLKVGDHIVRVNNKSTKSNRNKIMSEINESKFQRLLLVIKRSVKDFRHQSDMNLSSSICSINNNFQTFRNSKSSIDLNYSSQPSKNIFDSNYVAEDLIKNYIQYDSSTAYENSSEIPGDKVSTFFTLASDRSLVSLDDSDSTQSSHKQSISVSPSPVQITRKQAYKKSIDETDNIYQSQQPRINRKKATNTISISNKDPVVTVKKKINPSMDDVHSINRNFSINFKSKMRYPTIPVLKNSTIPGNNSNSNLVNLCDTSPSRFQSSISVFDSEDGNKLSGFKRTPNQQKDTPPIKETVPSRSQIEFEMKIISFKEKKIVKQGWKKYFLEQDSAGVSFECSDLTQTQQSLNSTALNPSIANPALIMSVWGVNNTMTKFYLPIGQDPYDADIIRLASPEEIKISYEPLKLEFLINLTRLSEESNNKLFKMLKVSPQEPKIQTIKHKKSISSTDAIRLEPKRSKQLPKPVIEKLLLSSLHKTSKVEGVPLVVVICVTLIEEIGLREEGIYRKSGNLVGKRLLEEVIANESPDKWSINEAWTNVNTTSNLFKSFLRKYILLDKDTAIKLSTIKLDMDEPIKNDTERKLQDIMDMIYHLTCNFKSSAFTHEENKCRLDTFKYIIKHLYRVYLCQEYTKMNAENLATCFVPNLIEDIPVDDDVQYKESRKNVAHEYLTKMVTFWIINADTICELLEEEKEDELNKKVINFLNQKNLPNYDNIMKIDKGDIDLEKLVKERIEFYTENVTITNLNSSPTDTDTPESYFSRTKNTRPYQSVKQPRTNKNRRRNNSGSSMDFLKSSEISKPIEGSMIVSKNEIKNQMGSPTNIKKSAIVDMWPKNLKKSSKEMQYSNIPDIQITSLLISGNKKDIPLVVTVCIDIIETFGLKVDGIYRISGRNQDINHLISLVMTNETEKWIEEANVKIWASMHNTACLLKRVLKKFCLIPKDTWMHMSSQFSEKLEPEDVKKVLKAAAYHLRVEEPKSNIYHSMGRINSEEKNDTKQCEMRFRSGTLRYVLKHLKHVSRHASDNRMSSNSLAVCFVPVLMEEDYSSDIVTINTKCIQIVQLLIDHCQWIFQWDSSPPEDLYGQKMSDSLEEYLKDYKSTSCYCADQKENNFIANYDDIKQIVDQLIQSSYLLDEFGSNCLQFLNVESKSENS